MPAGQVQTFEAQGGPNTAPVVEPPVEVEVAVLPAVPLPEDDVVVLVLEPVSPPVKLPVELPSPVVVPESAAVELQAARAKAATNVSAIFITDSLCFPAVRELTSRKFEVSARNHPQLWSILSEWPEFHSEYSS